MKNNISRFFLKASAALLIGLSAASCNYLDVDPELGLTEEDVFGTTKNFKAYFNNIFSDGSDYTFRNIHLGFPMYVDFNRYRFALVCTTDAADAGRYIRSTTEFKACSMSDGVLESFTFCPLTDAGLLKSSADKPIGHAMYTILRIANRSLDNMDKLTNATPTERKDFEGQAYFVRAYAHFVLARTFGGVPYIDRTLIAGNESDLAREPLKDVYEKCAQDFYKAYKIFEEIGKMRRDALPGQTGHLTSSELNLPSGCAALAFRARALLYAASPWDVESGNPARGTQNDPKAWRAAAEAAAEALKAAEQWQYELLPLAKYKDNFVGVNSTNEVFWAYIYSSKPNISNWSGLHAYPQCYSSTASGACPTQNFVDKFETIDGYALNTEAERSAAIAAGSYNDQDPYTNRDPRLDINIVRDGTTTPYVDGVINIYYDPDTKSYPMTRISGVDQQFNQTKGWGGDDGASKAYTNTGYYLNKFWRGARGDKDKAHYHLDPLFRLSELYLDYAEAAFEATLDPNATIDCDLSAVEALNVVRRRAGLSDVRSEYLSDPEKFRERVRNERNVELAYEGNHYYYDIRRWDTAKESMTQDLYGMWVESCPVDAEHPKGRVYERRLLPSNRNLKIWKNSMYYFPFPDDEANTLSNFENWEKWK